MNQANKDTPRLWRFLPDGCPATGGSILSCRKIGEGMGDGQLPLIEVDLANSTIIGLGGIQRRFAWISFKQQTIGGIDPPYTR